MNSQARNTDSILRKTTPPSFDNEAHRVRLLDELRASAIHRTVPPTTVRHRGSPRLTWAAAGALAVAVGVALVYAGFATKNVRAEVLDALQKATSFKITYTTFRKPSGDTPPQSAELAVFHYKEGKGFAMTSARRKVWTVGNDICGYDTDRNEVTVIRGTGPIPVKAFLTQHGPLAGFASSGSEKDLGLKEHDGRTLHVFEVTDKTDPTQRVEVFTEPDTRLPVELATYNRDVEAAPWHLSRKAVFEYGATIDDGIFIPDYPKGAKIIEQMAPSRFQAGSPAKPDQQAWLTDAIAVARVDGKYIAVEGVWRSPKGWIGIKFRTNLLAPFTLPAGFAQDPNNQKRWGLDELHLNNLVFATRIQTDSGAEYISYNGSSRTLAYADGTCGTAYFYSPPDSSPAGAQPVKTLSVRTLAIARDRGRGESINHYFDWKEDPDKWKLFEMNVPVPEPSDAPPASFNETDIEWMQHTVGRRSGR